MTDTIAERIVRKKETLFTVCEDVKPLFRERIIKENGMVLREWNVKRSKLGAAILKGLRTVPINRKTNVMYLGASTGTTVSYISDIVPEGIVYAVELSYDPFVKLMELSRRRNNIIPILEDAGNPERYSFFVDRNIDLIYQDISQRSQVRIFNENAKEFATAKYALLVVKLRSISSKKKESVILRESTNQIDDFEVLQDIDLSPYDISSHMLLLKRR